LVKLTRTASAADRESAPFQRLTDIPKLAKRGTIGQSAPLWKVDADHPEPTKLGPLYWTPPKAPPLSLKDDKGTAVSLQSFKDKTRAVVLVFNLGTGCAHCNLQLKKLLTETSKFEKAGIDVVVVTSEKAKELEKSAEGLRELNKGTLPFKMVGDGDT